MDEHPKFTCPFIFRIIKIIKKISGVIMIKKIVDVLFYINFLVVLFLIYIGFTVEFEDTISEYYYGVVLQSSFIFLIIFSALKTKLKKTP